MTMTLYEFMEAVSKHPLPKNQMLRIQTLAREMAAGATEGLWPVDVSTLESDPKDYKNVKDYELRTSLDFMNSDLKNHSKHIVTLFMDDLRLHTNKLSNFFYYVVRRWDKNECPNLQLLEVNGYIELNKKTGLTITKEAFNLLVKAEPANVFISYKRSESSAFALLVLARLKTAGLEPFIDLAIEPGDEWHSQLEERIKACNYFIVLLGKQTLKSEITCKEIEWAIKYDRRILPVWHNRFKYVSGKWPVSNSIDAVINEKHAIRVLEESALAYNNAIVELLGKFGVMP